MIPSVAEGLSDDDCREGQVQPDTWIDSGHLARLFQRLVFPYVKLRIHLYCHLTFEPISTGHQARHPSVQNAYFVGASAHPGTGVPIALAGKSGVIDRPDYPIFLIKTVFSNRVQAVSRDGVPGSRGTTSRLVQRERL
jgi:hypothetical protein